MNAACVLCFYSIWCHRGTKCRDIDVKFNHCKLVLCLFPGIKSSNWKKLFILVNCKYNDNDNYFKNERLIETVMGSQKLKHFNMCTASTILSIIGSYNAEMNAAYASSEHVQVHCSTKTRYWSPWRFTCDPLTVFLSLQWGSGMFPGCRPLLTRPPDKSSTGI